jgi:hypothetical protein
VSAAERTAHGEQGAPQPEEDLTSVVRELTDRIEALQADVRRLGAPGLPAADAGWEDPIAAPVGSPSYAWVSSVSVPVRRRPAVPRLLLEVLFLAAAATAAGIAELDAPAIAAVMAGAWLLVALIEWAASLAERRRDAIPSLAPAAPVEPPAADPAWFVPPVEQTMVEPSGDAPTAVTRLPPPQDDLDATVEERPGS